MLPNTYRQLEYLESTGTQYINTGFVATSNLVRFIADYIPTEVNNLYYTYRVSGGYDGANRTLGLYGASPDGRVSAGGQDVQIGASFVANTRYLVNMVTNNGTIQGEINGVTITSTSYSGTSVQPYPYYVFAFNQVGSAVGQAKIKLYSFKLYENEVIVRDLIPVKRIADDVLGMYDLVNDVFYTNAGTGTFIGGAELPEVTTSVTPQGSGSVTGDGYYQVGDSVTLTATPNPTYQFLYYEINGVTEASNPYTFTITEDTTVVAYFTSLGHDVTLLVDPAGYGSVTGAGSYPQGASVTIEATPNTHKLFVNWTENGVEVSTNPSYTFTMGASDVTYTANFTDARIFTVKATPDPATLPLIYQSSEEVYEGESVILKAREVDGYVFSHWSNGSLDNPLVLTPTENTEIVAYYLPYSREDDGNYRAYIKDMTSVNTVPKANISVQSFTIKRDLLTSAVSTINALEVPANISNGDILVLYDPTGKIVYQGIVEMIEDASIQCRQIQSFYKGLWIYDTDTSESTIEGEIASLLNDYAQGKIKGSTYTDSLVATEKEPLMISTTSATSGNIETKEGTTDMETFIYDLYRDYGLLIDFDIPYGAWTIGDPNGGTAKISIPNYSTIKVGNNTESVTNLTPITEIAETNKLIVFSKSGTYRSTFVYTSTNGIVEEPAVNVGRYGVINTKVVYSDDNIDDIVKANLPQTMYNHHLTFDLLSVSKLYKFDEFRLGQPIDVWNGTDYYSTVLTGYEFTKEANQPVQTVHMICGKVRISLTSKLLLGVVQ